MMPWKMIRIDEDQYDHLCRLAKADGRSATQYLKRVLEAVLTPHEYTNREGVSYSNAGRTVRADGKPDEVVTLDFTQFRKQDGDGA